MNDSNIDTLIAQLCPDGVEFRELGEIGDFYGGLTGKSKNDFHGGNAKFVTYMNVFANISIKTDIDFYVKIGANEKQNRVEYGDVIFTGSSETPDECGMSSVLTEKITEPLYLNSFCFGFRLRDKNLFLPDFLKYLFRDDNIRKQIGQTASGVTRFNISKKRFAKVKIPLPPLPIQQEIVTILDNFSKLQAELQAELQTRRAQYEYYRNELLDFEGKEVEWKTLEEVCDINIGQKPNENILREMGNFPFVNAGLEPSGYLNVKNTTAETITIPSRGQGGAGYVGYQKKDFWCGPLCYKIKSKQINVPTKFIYYYLKNIQGKIIELRQTGSIPAINKKELIVVKIPIPPLAEQNRIVAILDKFDKLVNDISVGLPAEIQARRKQYEYYRGKLLTFKCLNR